MTTHVNEIGLERLLRRVIAEVRGHRKRYQEARSWFAKNRCPVKQPHTPLRHLLPLIQHWTLTRNWPTFSTYRHPTEEVRREAHRVVYVAWLLADIDAAEVPDLLPWDDWTWPDGSTGTHWALAEPERYEIQDPRSGIGPPLQEIADPPAGWREIVHSALGVVMLRKKGVITEDHRFTQLDIPVKLTSVGEIIGQRSDVIAGKLKRAKCNVAVAGRSSYAEDSDLRKIYPKYRSFRAKNEIPHDTPRRASTRFNAPAGDVTPRRARRKDTSV